MTILMPALMAAMFILPAYFMSQDDTKERTIAVYDGSTILLGQLESNNYTKYKFIPKEEYEKIKDHLKSTNLLCPCWLFSQIFEYQYCTINFCQQHPFDLKNQIQNKIKAVIEKEKMAEVIKQTAIPDLETRIAATKTQIQCQHHQTG